jgi:hypothetical protein
VLNRATYISFSLGEVQKCLAYWRIMSIVGAVECIDVLPLPALWITVYTDLIEATMGPLDSKVVECNDGCCVLQCQTSGRGWKQRLLRVSMVKLAFRSLVDESVPVLPTEVAL